MSEHRYILDKSSKKHTCPDCGKRRFVYYIEIETGEYLPKQYGRCDREANCSYHLNPYTDGYGKMEGMASWSPQKRQRESTKPEFIPVEILKQTLQGYEQNVFLQNLLHRVPFPFETTALEQIISLYYLGTVCNGYRTGSITFPFIDVNNNVRAIQVKQFDNTNHTIGTDFLHSIIKKHHQKRNEPLPAWLEAYQNNESKVSSLFGAHLLNKHKFNSVALVEAPKTAIYGALYFGFPEVPENLLWLAVYSLKTLTFEKCKVLKGRYVYLFPDLSKDGKAFELWSNKANEFENKLPGTKFIVSDLLEKNASETDRLKGLDFADYLIKHAASAFNKSLYTSNKEQDSKNHVEYVAPNKTFLNHSENSFKAFPYQGEPPPQWNIEELETFFYSVKLPTGEIKLNDWSTITDVKQFIRGHLDIVKPQNGKRIYLPYFNRLQDLKNYLVNNKN